MARVSTLPRPSRIRRIRSSHRWTPHHTCVTYFNARCSSAHSLSVRQRWWSRLYNLESPMVFCVLTRLSRTYKIRVYLSSFMTPKSTQSILSPFGNVVTISANEEILITMCDAELYW